MKRLSPLVITAPSVPLVIALVWLLLVWSVHRWNVPPWAVVTIAVLLVPSGTFFVWYLAQLFVRRRLRFGLRSFLVGVLTAAILMATVGRTVYQRWNQWHALRAVGQSGGFLPRWTEGKNENWLKVKTGYDPFENVEALAVKKDNAVPVILQHKEQLSDLRQLYFESGSSDASLIRVTDLNDFDKLDSVSFAGVRLTDKGLQRLSKWTNVRHLFFNGGAFTDNGLAHLASLPNLTTLTFIGDEYGAILTMPVTDAGMAHLGRMSNLKTLKLIGIPLTDDGLVHLETLQGLERLTVHRTAATETGLATLREALPDCWVTGMKDSFPSVSQICEIRVLEASSENELIVIRKDDRIAEAKACFEGFVAPSGVQWQHEWQHDWESIAEGSIVVHFEANNRRLCSCLVGDEFLRNGWGLYRALRKAESLRIRKTLGLGSHGSVTTIVGE